jgi:hypothetical protein
MFTHRSSTRTRSRSFSHSTASTRKMSKSLELPSSLLSDIFRIVHHIALVFCRRVIFAPPKWKIFIYFVLIILGPFIKDIQLFPTTVSFALKIQSFNYYISQIGWSCSLSLLLLFVYFTSLIYTRAHYGLISRHLIRLLIATIIWYFTLWILVHFESLTSICKPTDTRRACQTWGRYSWQEGHTFFYLYALLVINEEVKLYDENWKKVEEASKFNPNHYDPVSSNINQTRLRIFSRPIGCLYFALALLTILWELMLLSAAIYFYDIFHKLLAATLAIVFWLITYRGWFRQSSSRQFAPCLPGDGFILF